MFHFVNTYCYHDTCLASVQADLGGMQCIQAMPAGVGQWVWVSDFKGFGMSDCDPRLAKVFLDLSAAHYPERLGLFLVIDAPWSAPFCCPHVVLHTCTTHMHCIATTRSREQPHSQKG